jgi:aminopeptidase N
MNNARYVLLLLILISQKLTAQSESELICKWEAEKFLKSQNFQTNFYPGDSTVDIKYYKLNLTVTTNPNYLIGEVIINAASKANNLQFANIDLHDSIIVNSISIGTTLLNYTRGNNKLHITLDKIYGLNEMISIKINYQGVPSSTGFGSFTFGNHNGQPAIYTLSEPYGAKDWWPCKDSPADKADSVDVWITCSNNLIGVSNGKLIHEMDNGNGTKTFKWKHNYPISHYLVLISITNYTKYTNFFKFSQTDSMAIDNYIYPEFLSSVKDYLDRTPLMMQIFTSKFGEYPFINEKYGHAQFGWSGGMEHQTCTSLGSFGDGIISHELAHQWFGDKVTCKDWHHIWINEGFATYSEAIFYENAFGVASYQQDISNKMNSAKGAVGSVYVQDISSVNNIFNYARTYAKGCVVLHMLRGVLGDYKFFTALQNFVNHPQFAYNSAGTEDFKMIAENVYGSSLNYFFQQWIYGENYPKYTVNWNYTSLPTMHYKVDFTINQQLNSNPSYFSMPVQVKIKMLNGDTLFTVFNSQQTQSFSVHVPFKPIEFQFDPNNWILRDAVVLGNVENGLPFEFKLYQNYPNPFNPVTSIQYSVVSRQHVLLKVYDILGNEVATLVNEEQDGGRYTVQFDGSKLASGVQYVSGVYIYSLTAGDFKKTNKMLMLK